MIESRREADFYREQDYRRFEELTDISERLSIPIETVIPFLRGEDGKVYSTLGDRVVDVVRKGYESAKEAANFRGDIGFEVERRSIEIEEAQAVEALQDGAVMMVISPIPDAVRDGSTTIGGYHRERMRAMVRLYMAQGGTITCITLSLDKSDYQGLQAVAAAVGAELPDGLGSEQILSRRYTLRLNKESFEWLPVILRESYDNVLAGKFGGDWYGGAPFASKQDALGYVMQHPDLIDEHMAAIAGDQSDDQKEESRQRLAAAIDARYRGETVESLYDSVVDDALAAGDYSGDCADLTETAGQLAEMGMQQGNVLKCVKCPLPNCGRLVDAKKTPQGGIFCPACKREARGGKIIDHQAERARQQSGQQTLGRAALTGARDKTRNAQAGAAAKKTKQPAHIKEQKIVGIGEEKTVLFNAQTKEVLATV